MRSRSTPTVMLGVVLGGVSLILRLQTLSTFALTDPSEGRYATIAQEMFLSGDWVTPRTFQDGVAVPFLGKPPLFFWATALSYKLFGMNELASRFPSFVSAAGTCLLTGLFASAFLGAEVGALSVLVLLSSVIFFFASGICLTDPVLAFAATAAFVSFAFHARQRGAPATRTPGILFFASLALGMLTKGPVALVLVGLGILLWVSTERRLDAVRSLPWISGSAIFLVLVSPWFAAAERASPGFLRYFFVNENFLRFLVHDYGDRYGAAHTHPRGFVWLFFIVAALPWSVIIPVAWWNRRSTPIVAESTKTWLRYALCWAVAAPSFFTLARQVSFSYVLPSVPGVAVCFAAILVRLLAADHPDRIPAHRLAPICSICAACLLLTGLALGSTSHVSSFTCALAGAAMILFLRRAHPHSAGHASLSAAAIVLLYSSALSALGDEVTARLSAKEAVEAVETEPGPKIARVGFVAKVPNSAYFYGRDEPGESLSFGAVKSGPLPRDTFDYLFASPQRLNSVGLTPSDCRSKAGQFCVIRGKM